MPKDKLNESWTVKVLGLALEGIAIIIFNIYLRFWRFLKYKIFRFKDWRIIYGETPSKRQIFHFPKARRQHSYIKGLTGFGKSALAAILAIQIIRQGGAGIFLDPHGNPRALEDQKGAIVLIYQRAESVKNVVFLSVNQKKKVIGDNPLILFGKFQVLDELKDNLLNAIFYDTNKISLNSGYQVPSIADFILESAIYFHNAYLDWLVKVKQKEALQVRQILLTHQITINDLAYLEDNPSLIDLFIEILGFAKSKYYRPDLVSKWQKLKAKLTFDAGFKGAVGRFKKVVSTSKSKLFFESCGFDLFKERKKGKFVLCDLSGLDEFTTAILCKLLLVKIFIFQIRGIFWGQTEFFIDEAPNIEIANLPQIITQGRKKKLALTLIFHFFAQFSDTRIINAIQKGIVTKINFKNNEGDLNIPLEKISQLKNQEFIFTDTWEQETKVRTLELPPIRRQVEFEERGVEEKVLRQRMQAKRADILAYFQNV
jgi:hypothetical protein